jgi:hypothetical protein
MGALYCTTEPKVSNDDVVGSLPVAPLKSSPVEFISQWQLTWTSWPQSNNTLPIRFYVQGIVCTKYTGGYVLEIMQGHQHQLI